MELVHVIPSIRQEAAGPSYSVPRLCEALAQRGHSVELNCTDAVRQPAGVRLSIHPAWRFAHQFAPSVDQARTLRLRFKASHIVHNHGLWTMGNVVAGLCASPNNAKLVTSPRGMLRSWALQWHVFRKRSLWLLQRHVVERASLLHATSEMECADLHSLGLAVPVAIIPNGIDIPVYQPRPSANGERTLLFLSRLHPSKGVDRLLEAWAGIQSKHPGWGLLVAGPSERDYGRLISQLADRLRLERVTFSGPVYGDAKSRTYFSADLFVLPTHSENFGMVVAEALAHACPVVVSRAAPWSQLESVGCGWWVDNDTVSLADTLDHAMSLSRVQLESMGSRGRAWMQQSYGWDTVAEQMETAYLWVLYGGKKPSFVFTS